MTLVNVKILFFAQARELSGKKEVSTSLETPTKFSYILERLIREYSLHLIRNSIIIAVNETYVDEGDEITLRDGDVIAVIPPIIASKMDFVDLTYDKIDINSITQTVSSPKCGAISLFVGTTRDNFGDMNVVQLVYEAYNDMALKVMKELCEEVRAKWPDIVNMGIVHRLGEVPVAEASVVIAVASPHRPSSLAAVSYAIDRLKASVPIWKKEEYDNGPPCWKENAECKWKNGRQQSS